MSEIRRGYILHLCFVCLAITKYSRKRNKQYKFSLLSKIALWRT